MLKVANKQKHTGNSATICFINLWDIAVITFFKWVDWDRILNAFEWLRKYK